MKFFSKERLGWVVAVAGLASVLVGLAVLQYRWSGEVSDATSQRLTASLHFSLLELRQDLGRELAAAGSGLQLNRAVPLSTALAEFPEQFQRWRQAAAHPALVANVYVWDRTAGAAGRLLRFDPESGAFTPSEWPSSLAPLHGRLRQMSEVMDVGPAIRVQRSPASPWEPRGRQEGFRRHDFGPGPGRMREEGGAAVIHPEPQERQPERRGAEGPPPERGPGGGFARISASWVLDQALPALVRPVLREESGGAPRLTGAHVHWMIIELSRETLAQHMLPELAQRYLGGPDGLIYKVAVIGSDAHTLIYSSEPNWARPPEGKPDAAISLFGPVLLPRMQMGRMGPQRPPGNIETAPGQHEARLGPPWLEMLRAGNERDWQLIVKHRAGSLEAAVRALRVRTLAVSFGVLVLLGITMALILITSQRAQRLARLQMDFVTSVSHELRTPLAVIYSAAENIADGVVDGPQQMTRYGTVIKRQAQQLTHLVEQVLLFASTRQDRHRYELKPVAVAEVVDAALSSAAGLIESAGTEVERHIDPDVPPVLADPAALALCLQNLITNAIKYGGDRRWMSLAASPEENEGRPVVRIVVRDKGIGIAAAELKHIFDPFYRSPAATAAQIHGSGLGLSLARTIIAAMAGTLTAESELGRGSAFIIELPGAGTWSEGKGAEEKPEVPSAVS